MNAFVALLRGINVGGHHKVPMAELRDVCRELGWQNIQTYIQSGNIIFSADGAPTQLEADLEQAIVAHFGFSVPVIIRSNYQWATYATSNPFPEASAHDPRHV